MDMDGEGEGGGEGEGDAEDEDEDEDEDEEDEEEGGDGASSSKAGGAAVPFDPALDIAAVRPGAVKVRTAAPVASLSEAGSCSGASRTFPSRARVDSLPRSLATQAEDPGEATASDGAEVRPRTRFPSGCAGRVPAPEVSAPEAREGRGQVVEVDGEPAAKKIKTEG
jgi:hypothetical protein